MSEGVPQAELREATVFRADADHEGKCRRCGISCHMAIPSDRHGLVAVPGLRCQFLEQEPDGRFGCTVYLDRFARAPWCHHADEAAPLGYLASDCPYGTPPGLGKVRLPDDEFDRVWPEMLRKMRSWGVPIYVHRDALIAEVRRRTGIAYELEPWPGDPERLRLRGPRPLELP